MLDIPVADVQIVQEFVVNETENSTEDLYHMSEIDLSFCDALAGMCSGETSSGPTQHQKKMNFDLNDS